VQDFEDQILKHIGELQNRILESDLLINTLKQQDLHNNNVKEKELKNLQNQQQIKEFREKFRCVARRGAVIYFAILQMSKIDPMYQYSLDFFTKFLLSVIKEKQRQASSEGYI